MSRAYGDADQERYLLERSQDISSREMQELNDALQHERDRLESRVSERTAALAASEARFRSFTSLGSDWYWEQDAAFRFTAISGNFADVTGFGVEEHLGRTLWELPGAEAPDGGWALHRARLESHETFFDVVLRREHPVRGYGYAAISGEPVFDADGYFIGYRGIGREITQQKLAEENINRLAHYDTLTSLFNRAAFFERLNHALSLARRHGRVLAVLFIDLDRFKDVNDAFGHVSGDEVLKIMAQRLADAIRASDTAARLGGDEFIVLAEDVTREADVSEFAQRLLDALSEPFTLHGQECRARRKRRDRDVSARRRRRGDAAQEGRHRDVPGEGIGAQRPRVLFRSRQPAGRGPDRHGRRHPPRPRHRSIAAALSTEGVGAHRRNDRRRGARPLAASRARPAAARCVHSARRGFRPHPPHRPLGAAHRVRAGARVADGRRGRRFAWPSIFQPGSSATSAW